MDAKTNTKMHAASFATSSQKSGAGARDAKDSQMDKCLLCAVIYAIASRYDMASSCGPSKVGSNRKERLRPMIHTVSAAKNDAVPDRMAAFARTGNGGVPSYGEVDGPTSGARLELPTLTAPSDDC